MVDVQQARALHLHDQRPKLLPRWSAARSRLLHLVQAFATESEETVECADRVQEAQHVAFAWVGKTTGHYKGLRTFFLSNNIIYKTLFFCQPRPAPASAASCAGLGIAILLS